MASNAVGLIRQRGTDKYPVIIMPGKNGYFKESNPPDDVVVAVSGDFDSVYQNIVDLLGKYDRTKLPILSKEEIRERLGRSL